VDTNVLARFFTDEPPEMAVKARRLLEQADKGEIVLVVLPVIVAELVYICGAPCSRRAAGITCGVSHCRMRLEDR
jgi:predicted nucleic acid-binding protein